MTTPPQTIRFHRYVTVRTPLVQTEATGRSGESSSEASNALDRTYLGRKWALVDDLLHHDRGVQPFNPR